MLKIFRLLFFLVNIVVILALLVLHFMLKEHSFITSLYYYTFPLPIIIGIVLSFSVLLKKKQRKYNIILAMILLLVWLTRSFRIHFADTITNSDLEVVFWNASRDNGFKEAFKENEALPDVLVLVENERSQVTTFQLQYPDYHFMCFEKEEMGIFSKDSIRVLSKETSKFKSTIIHFKTNGVNFYAVDVQGSPDVPRSWELGFVNRIIKETPNTVVLGDFNVPYESRYLEQIKATYNHAFNEGGNGFMETWMFGFPLLSLDHIWVSEDLQVVKTQKINTRISDHSMVKTFIRK